jgi:acyl-coenzyme A thioesterase PaaI-like protein
MDLKKMLLSPWKMKFFQFHRLPSLWWWGVKIEHIDEESCRVSIPFSWRTQNPFKSVYFAAQFGAAEYSTGIPVLLATDGGKNFSMLVVSSKGDFLKKAIGKITFECSQVELAFEMARKAKETGNPQLFELSTLGKLGDGTEVSQFTMTWSIKYKG